MKPRNLLIAAILLAALSGAVWWSKQHPEAGKNTPANPENPKLTDIPAAQVASVTVTHKDGSVVSFDHQNNRWNLTKPEALPADQDAISSMVSSLSPVTADNVVEDKASDLSKYGLKSPSLAVAVKQKDGKTITLNFGDDIPAGSLVYARVNNQPKVYAVSSSIKTGLDKSGNDLRDKRLLTVDSNTVTSLEVKTPKGMEQFAKNNANDWKIVKPQPFRAESFQVEELLRKLTEAKMDLSGNVDDTNKTGAAYAAGQNLASAKVTGASGTQTLDVHKLKDDYYARSSAVKGAYKISSDLAKELEKPGDDYRNKKVFDFGFSDPNKIELGGAVGDKTLVRSGTDWKIGGKTMDPGSVQAFIDKLRDLTAAKLVTTGFTTSSFRIAVTSNEGKRNERVEFAKVADNYLARRENEPALYQIDAKTASDLISASKAIKPAAPAKK